MRWGRDRDEIGTRKGCDGHEIMHLVISGHLFHVAVTERVELVLHGAQLLVLLEEVRLVDILLQEDVALGRLVDLLRDLVQLALQFPRLDEKSSFLAPLHVRREGLELDLHCLIVLLLLLVARYVTLLQEEPHIVFSISRASLVVYVCSRMSLYFPQH